MKHILPILLLLNGCGDETSLPQPVPVPAPKLSAIRQSTPMAEQSATMVLGLTGAVSGMGRVIAKEVLSGRETHATSTKDGTFSLVITNIAQAGGMELRFETVEGERSEPLLLATTRAAFGPVLSPADAQGEVVSAPDTDGIVTVSSGSPQLIAASPDVDVLISNANTGEVVLGVTDENGAFSLQLHGEQGQQILILLVEPANPEQTSDFLAYEVP
ncbi:MAG: hypothetical protein JRH20_02470 [Deltaproteobacteria bacterium]|nr:hypothetical protein [Deltaproteobacteria bacterium]